MSAPAFRHAVHRLKNPEEFSQAISGASLSADFLAPSHLPSCIEQFQAPNWSLDFQKAYVKARITGPVPQGWVSMGLMRGSATSSWYGTPASAGTLACTPATDGLDGYTTPGFECLTVSIPEKVWENCRCLAGSDREHFSIGTVLQLPPDIHAKIERQAQFIQGLLRGARLDPHLSDSVAHSAAEFALDVASTAWELSDQRKPCRDSIRNRTRLARRAEAWLREHLAEPLRIPDLCLALRVSRRELEYAFRTTFDESPRDYLHSLRLNAIHRSLRRSDPDESVLKTLLQHGLSHPGRFAADYKNFFGHSPRHTLQRRQKAG
jgi:AraC family transcriptional regulator, ethanolamine operon transcriptional activator